MTFDADSYLTEVLEPARQAEGRPPADLLLRYGLSLPLTAAEVAENLPAVLGTWRRARRELKYRKLISRLEADHARLAAVFDKAKAGDVGPLHAAVAQARSASDEKLDKLRDELADIAGPVRRITPALAGELATGHGLEPGQVAPLLVRLSIEVAEPDPLPADPPVTGYPRYREALRTLGCRHTADFVLDESRDTVTLDGVLRVWDTVEIDGQPERRVVASTVHTADLAWAARPHDGSRTLASTVLVTLKALLEQSGPTGVAALVRYEVAEELRTRHRQGASAGALVDYASASLGLADDDARRIAFAVRAEPLGAASAVAPSAVAPDGVAPEASVVVAQPVPAATPPAEASAAPVAPDAVPAERPGGSTALSATPPGESAVPAGPLSATASVAPEATGTQPTAAKPTSTEPTSTEPTGAGTATGVAATPSPAKEAPLGAYAPLPSPDQVVADRAGDEVVVRWQWPTELTEVLLRWQPQVADPGAAATERPWRERLVSRGAYRSQGGAWLPLTTGPGNVPGNGNSNGNGARNAPLRIELTAMAPRHGRRVRGAPVTVRLPGRIEAWYEVSRTGPPWRRELTVAVRTDEPTQLRRLMVVLRRGTVMPLQPTDGEVLRQLEHVRVAPEAPLRLRLPVPRGPYWLRCFAADDDVALRDPPVVQLRGR
ncbi:MAG: hypothetical protein ACRDT6_24055 [Micromonosporaceae bacterium]